MGHRCLALQVAIGVCQQDFHHATKAKNENQGFSERVATCFDQLELEGHDRTSANHSEGHRF